jgi:hypothetical protein
MRKPFSLEKGTEGTRKISWTFYERKAHKKGEKVA